MKPTQDNQSIPDNDSVQTPPVNQPQAIPPQGTTVPQPPLPVQPVQSQPVAQASGVPVVVAKKKKVWLFIVIGIVLLTLIGIVVLISLYPKGQKVVTQRPTNSNNETSKSEDYSACYPAVMNGINYTDDQVTTHQMEGKDIVSNQEQMVSFKIANSWELDEEYSENNYSGDPFFKKTIDSGKTVYMGLYTMPAVSSGEDAIDSRWLSLDEAIELYNKSNNTVPDSDCTAGVFPNGREWDVLMFNNTNGGNARRTVFYVC